MIGCLLKMLRWDSSLILSSSSYVFVLCSRLVCFFCSRVKHWTAQKKVAIQNSCLSAQIPDCRRNLTAECSFFWKTRRIQPLTRTMTPNWHFPLPFTSCSLACITSVDASSEIAFTSQISCTRCTHMYQRAQKVPQMVDSSWKHHVSLVNQLAFPIQINA